MPIYEVSCTICGSTVKALRRGKLYCSTACANRRRYGMAKLNIAGLSPGTRGALSELVVCSDLLGRGLEVFRAVSPSCSCDLTVFKEGALLRVEVRTGYRDIVTGRIVTQRKHKADVLAICINGSEIIYEPPF